MDIETLVPLLKSSLSWSKICDAQCMLSQLMPGVINKLIVVTYLLDINKTSFLSNLCTHLDKSFYLLPFDLTVIVLLYLPSTLICSASVPSSESFRTIDSVLVDKQMHFSGISLRDDLW